MRTVISNTIRIENPSEEIMRWCKEFLVIPNPEYAKKQRMHLWTGNTPPRLTLYEMNGDGIILPFGTFRDIYPMLRRGEIISDFQSPQVVDYGESVPLYDYQQLAVDQMHAARYGILQSPAGSGKTQMGIALIKRYGRKALWLTHTQDLLRQSRERAQRYMNTRLLGTITDGKVSIGKGITFATVQTMSKIDLARYRNEWDVIIVDECHRVAGTPTSMTQFYKVLNNLAARHKYGLSATVHRADGMILATYALLGHVVHIVPDEAVADKVMKVGIRPIGTRTQLSNECLNTDGTLNYTKFVNYLCNDLERTHYIGRWIISESTHPSLILSDRLNHLEALMNTLPAAMRELSVMISGKMNTKKGKEEREQAIENMRTGRKKYLFATYSLAKEGLDIPCLERLFLTSPVKDYAIVVQSIGRIARICDGKSPPIVIDFVDDIGYAQRCYRQRMRHYKKAGAYLLQGTED